MVGLGVSSILPERRDETGRLTPKRLSVASRRS